jgi:hypothetical protein
MGFGGRAYMQILVFEGQLAAHLILVIIGIKDLRGTAV